MTISTALRMGSGFLTFVVIARSIGAEQFGVLSYWMAIAGLLALPVNYGFGMQLLREVGANKLVASKVMTETIVAKVVLSIIVFVGAVVSCFLFPIPKFVFLLILLMFVLESFAEHMNFLLRANAEFDSEAKVAAISSAAALVLLAGVAVYTRSLNSVCVAYLLSRVISISVAVYSVKNLWGFSISEAWRATKRVPEVLGRGFSYATDVAVGAVNSTLDTILVGSLLGPKSVGIYQSGMKLFQGFTSLAPIVSFVYLPELAGAKNREDVARLRSLADSMMRKLLIVGGGGAIFLCLAPTQLVAFLYGGQYEELASLLPWFALALMLRFMTAAFGVVLTALGLQAKRAFVNAGSVLVLSVGILILSGPMGLQGVLVALSVASLFVFGSYCILLSRERLGLGLGVLNSLLAAPVFVLIAFRIANP